MVARGLVWLILSVGLVCGCCWVLVLSIDMVVWGLVWLILSVGLV